MQASGLFHPFYEEELLPDPSTDRSGPEHKGGARLDCHDCLHEIGPGTAISCLCLSAVSAAVGGCNQDGMCQWC